VRPPRSRPCPRIRLRLRIWLEPLTLAEARGRELLHGHESPQNAMRFLPRRRSQRAAGDCVADELNLAWHAIRMASMSMIHMPSHAMERALEGAHRSRSGLSTQRDDCMRPGASWTALASYTLCAHAQTSSPRRTVLIVEDDPVLRKTMSEHVARMDVRVLTCSSSDRER
jgi:hypothetical protein